MCWNQLPPESPIQHSDKTEYLGRRQLMARDTADFAQQSSERAMQAANFGMTWGREFAEESFNQSRQAVDGFLRVARKMAGDFETQANATREQMTSLTHKTLSNTMEFGQKLAQAKTAGIRAMPERVHGAAGADDCGPDEGVRPEDAESGANVRQQCVERDG
jgi:hypothetical protein